MSEEVTDRKIFVGLGWSTVSTIVNGLAQVLRLSVLSRFLEKEDFGIVTILTLTLGVVQIFSDLGFSSAIMSQKNLDKDDFIGLFWLQFVVYNSAMIILSISSSFVASYYSYAVIAVMLPIVLSELFFISIGRLYETVLQKEMRFKTIAIRNIVASLVSIPLAVVLAMLSFGAYSLILSTLAHAVIINLWNFFAGQTTYRLKIQIIDFKKIRGLLKVGGFQMGTQIMDFISSRIDIFIIGLFFTVGELGLYNLAKEIVSKFTLVINAIVNKVLLPLLTTLQDDVDKLKVLFGRFIRKVSIVNVVFTSFIFIFADVIIYYFYGEKYIDGTIMVRVTALCSFFGLSSMPNGLIAISMKKTDVTFLYTLIRMLMTVSILFLFGWISMEMTLMCMILASILGFFLNWWMLLKRTVSLGLRDYLDMFKSASIIFILSSVFLTLLWDFYGDYHNIFLVLFFAFIYILFIASCMVLTGGITIRECVHMYRQRRFKRM